MTEYIIGVDAGGTKTTATAYDTSGNMQNTATGEFGNVTVDFDKGIENIKATIDALLKTQKGVCRFICLGCAGIETGDKKQRATDILSKYYKDIAVFCTNDALLALYSALEGKDGVLIIAGTGSIGYLKKDGCLYRCGGWGHLINDDGSGYSIGIKAIRSITDSFDNNKTETPLKKAVFEKLNIKELKELIAFVYASDKAQIASLVPTVEALANSGDEEAVKILEWAGDCLAKTAKTLIKLYMPQQNLIALSGSVIKKTALVNKRFREQISSLNPVITEKSFDPQKGGYYIYKEKKL